MKKQIAVLMAAATAVTTVAPVLASADTNEYSSSVSEANAKIKAALNERYKNKTEDGINAANANTVDAYLNSRYAVAIATDATVTNPDSYDLVELSKSVYKTDDNKSAKAASIGANLVSGGEKVSAGLTLYVVKDASRIQGLLENIVMGQKGKKLGVVLVDKGIKDGSAVETINSKHYVKTVEDAETEVSLSEAANELQKRIKTDAKAGYVKELKLNGVDKAVDYNADAKNSNVTKIEVTLTSGKEYTLEANDKAFDFKEPLAADGKTSIKITESNAQNVYDQVEGFKFIDNHDNKAVTLTLPVGNTDVYTVNDVEASTIELGKIFTNKDGYTKEGANLVNGIVKSRNSVKDKVNTNGLKTFNFRGVNYQYVGTPEGNPTKDSDIDPKIEKVSDGYVLKYTVVVDDLTNGFKGLSLQFVIKGESQKDLAIVLANLQGNNEVVEGKFTRLQGANRYATAVAVSQEKFDPNTATTVVITGGEALMDGLSAVPLASINNAPLLLANPKTGLDNETIKEIKRVCKSLNRKTVYVVGGEKSVPAKAVKQLEELGAVVERLSGSDRYDTSLEVARNLVGSKNKADHVVAKDLFIVGGEGAADAMSVSPVAATIKEKEDPMVSPVLVLPKDSVKKGTREFIETKFAGQNVHIVGGENTVSSNVYRSISKGVTLDRTSGTNRFDTNVQLIKKFYTTAGVGGAIFTSGDNKYLVDAQTAGPLAAAKKAPIVLTGAKLTDDQVNLLKSNGVLANVKTDVYQVGGVVSADVMSVVVDKLGL